MITHARHIQCEESVMQTHRGSGSRGFALLNLPPPSNTHTHTLCMWKGGPVLGTLQGQPSLSSLENEWTDADRGQEKKGRKNEERKEKRSTHRHAPRSHSTSQQKGTESLTHSAVLCWRWGSDSHGRWEAVPVSDARPQADHRCSVAVKECGQSTFFPRFVSERGTTSAHPPLHTRSQPPSLSISLSHYMPLSLSLIVCDGNAIAVCVWVCACVCARVCVSVWSGEACIVQAEADWRGESSYCITLCFPSHPYSARAPALCCILQRGT